MGYMFHLMLSTLVVKYSPKSQGKKLLLVIKCQFYFMYFRAQWKKKTVINKTCSTENTVQFLTHPWTKTIIQIHIGFNDLYVYCLYGFGFK